MARKRGRPKKEDEISKDLEKEVGNQKGVEEGSASCPQPMDPSTSLKVDGIEH